MIAAIIFILLSAADIATTHRFLQLGIREANPIMRWAFDKLGFVPASALKMALTCAIAAGLLYQPVWLLWACCAMQGAVVGWNLYLIRGRS